MQNSPCPTAETLLGWLAADTATGNEETEEHVAHCQVCEDWIAKQIRDDAAVQAVVQIASALCSEERPLQAETPRVDDVDAEVTVSLPGFPERVDVFDLLEPIGAGGMGRVFRALDTRLNREVAVKLLTAERSDNPQAIARFLREWQAGARIIHPNVVTVLSAGQDDGTPYLVMELASGRTAAELVNDGHPLAIDTVCRIGADVAAGLQAIAENGLVHRDIKPANIIVADDGSARILDLGLARSETIPDGTLTHEGAWIGTPAYMAPEQFTRSRDVDFRADLYALGCTIFCLLTGRPPFHSDEQAGAFYYVRCHCDESPPDVRTLRPDVPAGLALLISQLLAKSPDDRPASGAAVAQILADGQTGRWPPTDIDVVGNGSATAGTATAGNPTAGNPTAGHESVTSHRGVRIGLLLLILGTTVGLVATGLLTVFEEPHQSIVPERDETALQTTRRMATTTTTDSRSPSSSLKQTTIPQAEQRSVESDLSAQQLSSAGELPVKEPPALAEWIAARSRIITVSQNGTADYSSIREALAELQSGEAVEVLDDVTWRETIDIETPPFDTGLFTRVGTRLVGETRLTGKAGRSTVHAVSGADTFRIAGFSFLPPASYARSKHQGTALLRIGNSTGAVVEDCVFLLTDPTGLPRDANLPLTLNVGTKAHHPGTSPTVIRENALVNIEMGHDLPELASSRQILRNLLIGVGGHGIQIRRPGDSPGIDNLVVQSNVIHKTGNWLFGIVLNGNWSGGSGHRIHLTSNTTFVRPIEWLFLGTMPEHDVRIADNILFGLSGGLFLNETDEPPIVPAEWTVGPNAFLYSQPAKVLQGRPERPRANLPRSSHDLTAGPEFLSTNPLDVRLYMRIPQDGQLAVRSPDGPGPAWFGALPPGPAPPEGDWLIHLLSRLQQLNPHWADSMLEVLPR